MMPTYERRFFLGLLTKDIKEREEKIEELKNSNKNSKSGKQTRITGDALKNRLKSGQMPNM